MFRRNYTNHIAVSILICVAVPAIILFGIMQIDQTAFTRYHVSQVASEHLQAQVFKLDTWLDNKSKSVSHYSAAMESYIRAYGFDENISRFLTEVAKSSPDVTYVYVSSESGKHYVSDNVDPKVDGREREWYKGAVSHDVYVSSPYKDVLTDAYVMTFSKAIRSDQGFLEGVIGMDVLLTDIVKEIEAAGQEYDYHIIVETEEGVYPYKSEVFTDTNVMDQIRYPGSLINIEIDGHGYSGQKFEFGDMNFSIYVFLDMERYLTNQINFNKEYVVNSILILLFLVILTKGLSGFLYRPLQKMSYQVKASISGRKYIQNLVLPIDLEKIHEKFLALLEASEKRKMEVVQMNVHVHEHNTQIESVNQELASSYKDLETLKQELEFQEEKYLDLVNNMPDIIWICDANGFLIYGNKPFETLIGKKVNLQDQLRITDFMKDSKHKDQIIDLFLERDYQSIELEFLDIESKVRCMSGSLSRIYESGKLIAIQGIFRDMSESRTKYFNYYSRNRELTLVNDITKSLISNTELQVVLNDIAIKAGQIMNVSMCTIRLYEDRHFNLMAYSGAKESAVYDNNPSIEKSHMGIAFEKNKTLMICSESDFYIEDNDLKEALGLLECVLYIPMATNDKVYGIMSVGTDSEVVEEKVKILETLADQAAIAIERMQIFEKLRTHYFKTIEALVAANDAKVPNMEGHTQRVSEIAVEVGKRLYLRKKDIDDIYIAGLLHDIGKMNISDALLSKSSKLTPSEQNILDNHPMYAKKILEPIGMSDAITEGIYYHHKKYDLSGVPKTEKIESLPLIARIIGVVDELDALMVGRDGPRPLSLQQAMFVIRQGSGKDHCPEVVRVLEEVSQKNPELIEHHYSVQVDKVVSI